MIASKVKAYNSQRSDTCQAFGCCIRSTPCKIQSEYSKLSKSLQHWLTVVHDISQHPHDHPCGIHNNVLSVYHVAPEVHCMRLRFLCLLLDVARFLLGSSDDAMDSRCFNLCCGAVARVSAARVDMARNTSGSPLAGLRLLGCCFPRRL